MPVLHNNIYKLIDNVMKRISLILFIAVMVWIVQAAQAQTEDTTKNHVEVKKKVKKGAHGRTVTKIRMTGKGTPDAVGDAADGAVTGHLKPAPEPTPIVVTPPPPSPEPAPAPAPTVVVVHDTVRTPAPAPVAAPAPTTTEVTTTTETKPVTASVTTRRATRVSPAYHKPVHTYHRTYHKKTTTTPTTKTTTTTTVKKTD